MEGSMYSKSRPGDYRRASRQAWLQDRKWQGAGEGLQQ